MMSDLVYLSALADVLELGELRDDRTGVGTRSLFGQRMIFNLQREFPLLTTKRVHFRSVAEELFWMLRGETNINTLNATIWDEWADENGDLGPIYGHQWRNADGVDQISNLIQGLIDDPMGRRHVVNAWNVGQLHLMKLPPCHMFFQFYVRDGGYLDCQIYQRSADMLLGVPFNIASYALLTHIIAHYTGYKVGRLLWLGGDCHIYNNHVEQVKTQLDREPTGARPQLALRIPEGVAFDELQFEHLQLANYNPHPTIKAEVAV